MSIASLARAAAPKRRTVAASGNNLSSKVREEVDLRLVVRQLVGDDYDEFGRYDRVACLNPEHTDGHSSMLVFPDRARCLSCGASYSAVDVYLSAHPEAKFLDAAHALLGGDFQLDKDTVLEAPQRELDADTAVRNHLRLFEMPTALTALLDYGLSLDAIKHFVIGLATVSVRLDPNEAGFSLDLPRLSSFKDSRGRTVYVQEQERWAVPVFNGSRLAQTIYRKLPGALGSKTTLERGAGAQVFNLDALNSKPEVALWVEGWSDAIVWWEAGVPALTSAAGVGTFREEWAVLLKRVPRLFVLGDDDEAGRKLLHRVQRHIPWALPLQVSFAEGLKDTRDLKVKAGWKPEDLRKLLNVAQPWSRFRGKG